MRQVQKALTGLASARPAIIQSGEASFIEVYGAGPIAQGAQNSFMDHRRQQERYDRREQKEQGLRVMR